MLLSFLALDRFPAAAHLVCGLGERLVQPDEDRDGGERGQAASEGVDARLAVQLGRLKLELLRLPSKPV